MYRIGPTPPPLSAEIIERAERIEPATIGHYLNKGFAPGVLPLTHAKTVVGTAFTVRLADMDCTAMHYAADLVEPGHVVVVDMGTDLDRASIGAMASFAFAHRRVAGIVIDGAATDIKDLEATGLPIFARGLSAMTTRIRGIEGDINLPVNFGDSVVTPGQLVMGDDNGLVFVDPLEFDDLYDNLIAAQEIEPAVRKKILDGAKFSEIFGAAEHFRRNSITVP
ncbi:hypothetical protein ANMWB30_44530 [Arthrobacter sp. MWB30]|nr:hypothetical protein ANMWB30_44530 [Arthrobacter sp. MWB30]